MIALFSILVFSAFGYCGSSEDPTIEKSDFCKEINILIDERYNTKSGNYFANQIIPKIEKDSKIEASCSKGYFGYFYSNDSLFNSDINKWKEYYKCEE